MFFSIFLLYVSVWIANLPLNSPLPLAAPPRPAPLSRSSCGPFLLTFDLEKPFLSSFCPFICSSALSHSLPASTLKLFNTSDLSMSFFYPFSILGDTYFLMLLFGFYTFGSWSANIPRLASCSRKMISEHSVIVTQVGILLLFPLDFFWERTSLLAYEVFLSKVRIHLILLDIKYLLSFFVIIIILFLFWPQLHHTVSLAYIYFSLFLKKKLFIMLCRNKRSPILFMCTYLRYLDVRTFTFGVESI